MEWIRNILMVLSKFRKYLYIPFSLLSHDQLGSSFKSNVLYTMLLRRMVFIEMLLDTYTHNFIDCIAMKIGVSL